MNTNKAKTRVPLSTAIKEELYWRVLKLRELDWTIPQIFKAGVEAAERQEKRKQQK